jgi:hypothetical protein
LKRNRAATGSCIPNRLIDSTVISSSCPNAHAVGAISYAELLILRVLRQPQRQQANRRQLDPIAKRDLYPFVNAFKYK